MQQIPCTHPGCRNHVTHPCEECHGTGYILEEIDLTGLYDPDKDTVNYVMLFDPEPEYVNKIHSVLDGQTFIFIFLTKYDDAIKYDWQDKLVKSPHICMPWFIGGVKNYQKAANEIVKRVLED